MAKSLTTLTVPELISARTDDREAEAQRRLDHWSMSPKNVRRLTAYVAAGKAAAKAAPKVKKSRPTGPGSRGGDPVKAARARQADAAVADLPGGKAANMGAWWAAYRASK